MNDRGCLLALGLLLSACSGDQQGGPDKGTGGSSGSTGSPGSAGSASSGAAGGSASGGNASGGNGSGGRAGSSNAQGGGASVGCAGDFGVPKAVLTGAPGVTLGSPTLSADELELFYTSNAGGEEHFLRSTRARKSDVFPEGTSQPDLDGVCAAGALRGLDLSADGRRAYLTCHPNADDPGTLHQVSRADSSSPFVEDVKDHGEVGRSPAISHDELTLYTSGNLALSGNQLAIVMHSRSTIEAAFGPDSQILGFEVAIAFAPDPAPDDLAMFVGRAFNGDPAAVSVATRSSKADPFSSPTNLILGNGETDFGSPEVSQDCRSLYFIKVDRTDEAAHVFSLQLVTR